MCLQLEEAGRPESAIALCRGVISRAPHATWAYRRLGLLLLSDKQYPEAISSLQNALRINTANASTWEALGCSYQSLGRLTAALKAYEKALSLDPSRVYALVQKGSLLLALGQPTAALASYEAALNLDPAHAPALLGASESLIVLAGINIKDGALAAAASQLEMASERAMACAQGNPTLVAVWKQLGDALLLQRETKQVDDKGQKSSINGLVECRTRVVAASRRAYVNALRLSPNVASSWYDVSSTFYHEAQLQRMAVESFHKGLVDRCADRAEQLLRGALRLEPSSSTLWTALGITARNYSVQEYALSRSLQLDPRESSTWVALARLYIETGEFDLARKCLQHGRSHDPTAASIWEAMAALESRQHFGEPAEQVREFSEHAVGLGVGPEGLLLYAQTAIAGGHGAEGPVYVAARKAVALDSLNPAAWNLLGLACEAKGDLQGAVTAFRHALSLLDDILADRSALGTAPEEKYNYGYSNSSRVHPTMTTRGVALRSAVMLNLGRALVGAEMAKEATAVFTEVEEAGALDGQGLLWCAVAKAACGDLQAARYAVDRALNYTETDGSLKLAAMEVQLRLELLANPSADVLALLRRRLGDVQHSIDQGDVDVGRLFEISMAMAAMNKPSESLVMGKILSFAAGYAASTGKLDTLGRLNVLNAAAGIMHDGTEPTQCIRKCVKALHICPWSRDARVVLAATIADVSQAMTPSVLDFLPPSLTASGDEPELLVAALESRTEAVLGRPAIVSGRLAANEVVIVAKGIRSDPTDARRWYLASLLTTQIAMASQRKQDYSRALTWCRSALEMRGTTRQQRARLLICISEILLRIGSSDNDLQTALDSASKAFEESPPSDVRVLADAFRQLARCHWTVGRDWKAAESFYRKAMDMCGSEYAVHRTLATLELAQLLESNKDGKNAARVMNEQASFLASRRQAKADDSITINSLLQMVLLVQSLVLLRSGNVEDARAAVKEANAIDDPGQPLALLVQGAVALQQALSIPADAEARSGLLGEARRVLSEAIQAHHADGTVPRALLAVVEYAGTNRKKAEKIVAHASKAIDLSERPVPGQLLMLLAEVSASRTACARAVHVAPWEKSWWHGLRSFEVGGS